MKKKNEFFFRIYDLNLSQFSPGGAEMREIEEMEESNTRRRFMQTATIHAVTTCMNRRRRQFMQPATIHAVTVCMNCRRRQFMQKKIIFFSN